MITLSQIKSHPQIQAFIKATDDYLQKIGYTEHGLRHVKMVSATARQIARDIDLSEKEQELSAISGYLHDIGNFIGRSQHHYWSCFLIYPILRDMKMPAPDIALILNSIAAHDKMDIILTNKIAALVVLADKSDVHRSRVPKKDIAHLKDDIHSRVNYAVTRSFLKAEKKKKRIILNITINNKIIPLMEYFEIFTERMVFCRKAARTLGYKFGLIINKKNYYDL